MEAMNRQIHWLHIGCVPFSDFHLSASKSRWTIGCGTFFGPGNLSVAGVISAAKSESDLICGLRLATILCLRDGG